MEDFQQSIYTTTEKKETFYFDNKLCSEYIARTDSLNQVEYTQRLLTDWLVSWLTGDAINW